MKKFEEIKFTIPELKGISKKTTEEHLKLYAGYVKHANLILEKIPEYLDYEKEDAFAPYAVGEIQRRFSFEYNGMRNHEIYFGSFEGGAKPLSQNGALAKMIGQEWNSFDLWLAKFKSLALTRGIGWAMLCYDQKDKRLLNTWVDEQHLGQLNGCKTILALDMWEHSFVADYSPSGKKNYIEDYFINLNWDTVEENYKTASL